MKITDLNLHSRADHERVVRIHDPASGLLALVAIHSTALGPAFGGCRMRPYMTQKEALRDALRLSMAMSLKTAFAGLPFGGGKCVVIGDPATQKSEALLLALGHALNELGGTYLTADDSGTSVLDMEVMRRVTPHARGLPQPDGTACPAAAYGTYLAIKAAVGHRFGGTTLAGYHIAVQGLGALGLKLCHYLAEAGATLTVSDLNPKRVAMAVREFGARAVQPDKIMAVAADVLSLNALGDVINDETLRKIRAPIVAGGANNQLRQPRHGLALHRRGIIYVPDFAANVGGVIDVAMEGPDYSRNRVLLACGDIFTNVATLLAEAERSGVAPFVLAERIALERMGRKTLAVPDIFDAEDAA